MAEVRHPLFASITLEGFLSFGYAPHEQSEAPLRYPNVIIGPNGSGKSNLVEACGGWQKTYRKGSHSFDVLGMLDPGCVEVASPHAKRLLEALRGSAR
jgi:hypothetical protein